MVVHHLLSDLLRQFRYPLFFHHYNFFKELLFVDTKIRYYFHSVKSFFICDKTSNFVDAARKIILDSNYKKIAKKNSFFYRQKYSSDARIKDIYKLSKKFIYD